MKTVVIDLSTHCSYWYAEADFLPYMTLSVKSMVRGNLYWCCSFSRGYKNKTVEFGGTDRSIRSPRFTTACMQERGRNRNQSI